MPSDISLTDGASRNVYYEKKCFWNGTQNNQKCKNVSHCFTTTTKEVYVHHEYGISDGIAYWAYKWPENTCQEQSNTHLFVWWFNAIIQIFNFDVWS